MKNVKYLFIAILSFIGISSVKADSVKNMYFYYASSGPISYTEFRNSYINQVYDFQEIYSYYEENYKNSYPYFIYNSNTLFLFSTSPVLEELYSHRYFYTPSYLLSYDSLSDSYIFEHVDSSFELIDDDIIFPYLYSNFNFDFPYNYNSYAIGYKTSSGIDNQGRQFLVSSSDGIPTIYDYLELDFIDESLINSYQEINLNNYSYVALSLKDYSLRNNDINQFSTNIYTKGQLCLTPVYDYGLKEKTDFYTGYQVDRCSVIYSDFTPVRTYILKQDLENHAIYYLKAYDTSIDNIVKVDNTIFDITYISSEDEDSPNVIINGRSYPTIPYNDLSSSSTQSEDQGYISGQVNNVFENLDSNTFSSLFSNPLNLLSSCWGAILAILGLVGSFIGLLPLTLQAFLYSSFALAIVLGIIKIIL